MGKDNRVGVNLYQAATTNYPLTFKTASPIKEDLLLKGDQEKYYLLKKFDGKENELASSIEAEEYLQNKGFKWITPTVPMKDGRKGLEYEGQNYYLQGWQPELEIPLRWQWQLGSQLLARVHLLGENFQPQIIEGWGWPDWIQLFEMARDTASELHTIMVNEKKGRLIRDFDRTVGNAIKSTEEAIEHLTKVGYFEQRAEAMQQGYISLSQIPGAGPGLKYDLVGYITPDIPACGLGAFLGQNLDWSSDLVINDVVDLITMYNKIRLLSGDEIAIIKGFLKFPWNFWWTTEEIFVKNKVKEKDKSYADKLKAVITSMDDKIRIALQEL